MRTTLIVLASALLLAYFVTETISRLWPSNYTALLVVTAIALIINGIFNTRMAARAPSSRAPARKRQDKSRSDRQRGRGKQQDRKRDNRKSSDKPQGRKDGRKDGGKPRGAADKPKESTPSTPTSTGPSENGEVKWFNRSKGYGFIIRENGEEIFVHQRSVVSTGDGGQRAVLRDGQKVRFAVSHHEKGAQAENVETLD